MKQLASRQTCDLVEDGVDEQAVAVNLGWKLPELERALGHKQNRDFEYLSS